jgi:hypothetical protein
VKKFGLTAEKLAANVETQYDINKIQQEPLDPEVLAEGFTSSYEFPAFRLCGCVSEIGKLVSFVGGVKLWLRF